MRVVGSFFLFLPFPFFPKTPRASALWKRRLEGAAFVREDQLLAALVLLALRQAPAAPYATVVDSHVNLRPVPVGEFQEETHEEGDRAEPRNTAAKCRLEKRGRCCAHAPPSCRRVSHSRVSTAQEARDRSQMRSFKTFSRLVGQGCGEPSARQPGPGLVRDGGAGGGVSRRK